MGDVLKLFKGHSKCFETHLAFIQLILQSMDTLRTSLFFFKAKPALKSAARPLCHCHNAKNIRFCIHGNEKKRREYIASFAFSFFFGVTDKLISVDKNSEVNKLISQTLWETRRVCVSQRSRGKNRKKTAAAGREIPLPSGGRWRSKRHPTWGCHSTNNYSWAESRRRPRHYADPSARQQASNESLGDWQFARL